MTASLGNGCCAYQTGCIMHDCILHRAWVSSQCGKSGRRLWLLLVCGLRKTYARGQLSYKGMEQLLGRVPERRRPKARAVLKQTEPRPGRVMLGLCARGNFRGGETNWTLWSSFHAAGPRGHSNEQADDGQQWHYRDDGGSVPARMGLKQGRRTRLSSKVCENFSFQFYRGPPALGDALLQEPPQPVEDRLA